MFNNILFLGGGPPKEIKIDIIIDRIIPLLRPNVHGYNHTFDNDSSLLDQTCKFIHYV